MNDNVKVADNLVSRIRFILAQCEGKKLVPIKTEELLDYLHSLERLAVLERHLMNLCSDGYKIYA
jgi:hypothetical protein